MVERYKFMKQDGLDQDPIAITVEETAEEHVDLPIISDSPGFVGVKSIDADDAASMIFFALRKLKGQFNLGEGMDGVLEMQARILSGQEAFYGKLSDLVTAGLGSPATPSAPAMMDDEATRLAQDLLQKIIESRRTFDEFRARAMPEMERGGAASEQLIAVSSTFSEKNIIPTDLTKLDDEAMRILALDYGYIMAFGGISEDFLTKLENKYLSQEDLSFWFKTYFQAYPARFGHVPHVLTSLKRLKNTLTPRGYGS